MKYKFTLASFIFLTFFISVTDTAEAQLPVTDTAKKILPPVRKFYVGTALDGGIFSTALIKQTVTSLTNPPVQSTTNTIGIIRFTYFFNFGVTFNLNFSRHIGIFSGIDVKNIGYIDKDNGQETVKRRSYNIGAPLGIKIGNMVTKKPYVFLGGGIDLPFNYKEKTFVVRDEKTKFNEWFSQRTAATMPYVFAGFAINHGITFKVQYYPGNFLNPNYTNNGAQPYAGTTVNLILFSLGYAIPLSKKHDIVKEHVADLKTNN